MLFNVNTPAILENKPGRSFAQMVTRTAFQGIIMGHIHDKRFLPKPGVELNMGDDLLCVRIQHISG